MQLKLSALVLGAALLGGAAMAGDASDPIVIAQKNLMKSFGGSAKTLGGMAGGGTAYDADAAEAAKAALIAGAAEIADKWAVAGNDPEAESKPEIWTNWDDFMAKSKALGDAAAALDVSSVDGIKAGMGAIGGTCKDCHSTYRMD